MCINVTFGEHNNFHNLRLFTWAFFARENSNCVLLIASPSDGSFPIADRDKVRNVAMDVVQALLRGCVECRVGGCAAAGAVSASGLETLVHRGHHHVCGWTGFARVDAGGGGRVGRVSVLSPRLFLHAAVVGSHRKLEFSVEDSATSSAPSDDVTSGRVGLQGQAVGRGVGAD